MRGFATILMWAALPLAAQGLSGRRAPSFSLPDSTFRQFDILDFRGRWLLIDFMKTDCLHCKTLSRTLEEVKSRYGTKVAILSVVIPPDNMDRVGKYVAENKVTSPIVFDSSQVAASYFKITPTNHASFDTPHLFAIDPAGMIVHDWGQSSADTKDWVKEFDQLVAAKK